MKKVVMTVLVGLGFAGLQGYHVVGSPKKADFTNLILTGKYQKLNPEDIRKLFDQYNSIVNKIKELEYEGGVTCSANCKKQYTEVHVHHCIWYPENNNCCCRYKGSDDVNSNFAPRHYEVAGWVDGLSTIDWKDYNDAKNAKNTVLDKLKTNNLTVSDLITICKSGCDYVCKGVGDPGHNIYNPNNSTCACRIN